MRRVENRSAATIEEIVRECVHPDAIIHTDLWKGYSGLRAIGFEHHTVNQSICFKDEVTGVHTNTVEGTNNALKIMIRPRNRTKYIDHHLFEFVWRRQHGLTLWTSFLNALRDIHYE